MLKHVEKIIPIVKSRWFIGAVAFVVFGALVLLGLGNQQSSERVYTVEPRTVTQSVQLSGSVAAVDQLELSFASAGTIAAVKGTQGDIVRKGTVLAELEHDSLNADLKQAQSALERARANLALVRAQNRGTDSTLESARTKLATTITEQETLVGNAYRELLNTDLQAYQVEAVKTAAPLAITGTYRDEKTGTIILDFYSSGAGTSYSAKASGLAKDTFSFEAFGVPVALGSTGLYATIPVSGEGQQYGNTTWTIPIPNERSTSYQGAVSAYEQAKETKLQSVTQAESELNNLEAEQASGGADAVTIAQERQAVASVEEARAAVEKIQAQIEDMKIIAPFSGTIAKLTYTTGETVSAGAASGITLVSGGEYELSMSVPEIDVAKVNVGDTARITLDVYGDDASWEGEISEIELVETEVDGVPVYTSKILVTNPDNRIRIGMNARASILIAQNEGVLAVPAGYLSVKGDTTTVLVRVDENAQEERLVQTGLRGTDNFVEITEGLSVGEVVVAPSSR